MKRLLTVGLAMAVTVAFLSFTTESNAGCGGLFHRLKQRHQSREVTPSTATPAIQYSTSTTAAYPVPSCSTGSCPTGSYLTVTPAPITNLSPFTPLSSTTPNPLGSSSITSFQEKTPVVNSSRGLEPYGYYSVNLLADSTQRVSKATSPSGVYCTNGQCPMPFSNSRAPVSDRVVRLRR